MKKWKPHPTDNIWKLTTDSHGVRISPSICGARHCGLLDTHNFNCNKFQLFWFSLCPRRIVQRQHTFLSLSSHKIQPTCRGWSHLPYTNFTKGNLPFSPSTESPSQLHWTFSDLNRFINYSCSLLLKFQHINSVRKKLKMKLNPLSMEMHSQDSCTLLWDHVCI